MKAFPRLGRIGVLGTILGLAACTAPQQQLRIAGDGPASASAAHGPLAVSPPAPRRTREPAHVEAIRLATERFADVEVAKKEGWSAVVTPCMEGELGGQGFHYGNPELVSDGAQLDMIWPELLMYEPTAEGGLELVGVEYVIPTSDWTSEAPPRILGRAMHVNPKFDIWVLHVWLRENPSGVHADWNPDVSCRHAG